jgi:hypothetical protein
MYMRYAFFSHDLFFARFSSCISFHRTLLLFLFLLALSRIGKQYMRYNYTYNYRFWTRGSFFSVSWAQQHLI